MSKTLKDQTVLAFQTGGAVNPQTGTFNIQQPGTFQVQSQVPVYTPPPLPGTQPVTPNVPNVPTVTVPTVGTPTTTTSFIDQIGTSTPGRYDELKTYSNEAGQTLRIPFIGGNPIYPIPPGYTEGEPAAAVQTTQVTQQQPTTVAQQDGGGREDTTFEYGGVSYKDSKEATQAGADIYGATGVRGADIGMLGTFASAVSGGLPGLALNVAGKIGADKLGFQKDRPGSMGYAFGEEPMGGTGFLDYDTLTANLDSSGQKTPFGSMSPMDRKQYGRVALTSSQIQARLDVINGMGITPTGYVGYEMGDAVPGMPGAVMGPDGMARNPDGSVAKDQFGQPVFDSFTSFFDRVSMSTEEKKAADQQIKDNAKRAREGLQELAQRKSEAKKAEKARIEARKEQAKQAAGTARDFTAFGDYSREGKDDKGDLGQRGGEFGGGDASVDTGYGSGTDCLTEKMKVKLNGVIDFVTNIKVGDMIDGSVVKEVLHKHMRSGYFVINNELEITNDHPVWAKSGGLGKADWIRPEQLVVGDTINGIKVTSLNYIDRMTPTVSIVIDGDSFNVYTEDNTYIVHGRYREVRQEAA